MQVILAFTPGSAVDIVGRIVTAKLSEMWGQPVVNDNRAGAGGSIGSAAVARAAPDGYTLLVTSNAHTVNPAIYAKLPYDTLKDFTDIVPLTEQPNVLVVDADSPYKTLQRSGRCGEGQAGRHQHRPRRHRQRHAPQHREVHRRRGHQGGRGAVQGHAGGDRRDPQPQRGRLLGADLGRAVATSRAASCARSP